MRKFAPKPITFAPGIHPSAVVDPSARLGERVSIQPLRSSKPVPKSAMTLSLAREATSDMRQLSDPRVLFIRE